jgi:hypothetical protein
LALIRVLEKPSVYITASTPFPLKKLTASCQIGTFAGSSRTQPLHLRKWTQVEGLFISCSKVVYGLFVRFTFVENRPVLNGVSTSYEPFFFSLRAAYSINISTRTEEEEILEI